jgi:hypothetical protein
VRKTLWDKRLVGVIIESRKLKNLDFVSIFQTVSRFCYNALPNLISQYTKNRSNVLILVGIVSAKYKNYKKQDKRRLLWIPMLSRYGLDRQRNIF